jgi:hypothetical protein
MALNAEKYHRKLKLQPNKIGLMLETKLGGKLQMRKGARNNLSKTSYRV